ncbi:MAG: flagellar basal body rod protein FlgB [Alphaproteobacteria bacterium]|nr:flagellar basal body rod protein FlgB [Alphaproteobacteria bacterium]
MTIQDIGLFQAFGAKMDYLNQRQSVIAQNIANADTPGYRPQDLSEVDFSSMLGASIRGAGAQKSSVTLFATDEQHLSMAGQNVNVKTRNQRETYEVAPAGNAVVIEEQLIKASQNVMDYNLMLNVYQKQVGLIRTAIGTQ